MDKRQNKFTGKLNINEVFLQKYSTRLLLLAVIIVMIIILANLSPFFLTLKNVKNILNQTSTYLILSLGMTYVICAGGIDLSVGSIMGISAVIMGFSMHAGLPVGLAVLLGLIVGTAVGVVNGLLVSRLKINALIVTLSMMWVVRGAVLLITDARPVYGFEKGFTFWGGATSFFSLFTDNVANPLLNIINPPIAISLIMTVIFMIVLEKTRLGLYCFALGSNERSLHQCGVNINKYKIIVYAISGLSAALAGLIVAARLNTAEPLAGAGYEMDAIAAVVLGGTWIQGGSGSIGGTFLACLILAIIGNGLTILSISSNYQQLLTGLIVLVAVSVAESRKRKKREVL